MAKDLERILRPGKVKVQPRLKAASFIGIKQFFLPLQDLRKMRL